MYCNGSIDCSCSKNNNNYPHSAPGADVITKCYSDTQDRPWDGNIISCSHLAPSNSKGQCQGCDNQPSCEYTEYSNDTGTGGTHRDGCPNNNTDCQQTLAYFDCNAGYYTNSAGDACEACPAGYTSIDGTRDITGCYITVLIDHYIGAPNSNTPLPCGAGTYREEHDYYYGEPPETCALCTIPAGAAANGSGGGSDNCPWTLTCSPGQYYKYDPDKIDWGCKPCKTGHKCLSTTAYSHSTADKGLTPCPDGEYQNEEGKDFCNTCPSGTTYDYNGGAPSGKEQHNCYIDTTAVILKDSNGNSGTLNELFGITGVAAGSAGNPVMPGNANMCYYNE